MELDNIQDWPNLKRYEDENLSLGHPQENEKRVVFMGDSITAVSYTHLTLPTNREV